MIDQRAKLRSAKRLAVLAVAISGLAAAACEQSQARDAEEQEEFARTVNVEVLELVPTEFVERVRVTGTVEAEEEVTLSAEEGGQVARVRVPKGDPVRRGQAILELDAAVLRAQVAEAEASARLARDRHERQRTLWEERIGTEADYAQSGYEAEAAEARLQTLRARLAKSVIRSPIDGVLDARFPEPGEMVQAGQPVARVVRVDRLRVEGGVPERYAGQISRGDSARVVLDLFPGRFFPAVLTFVGTGVDPDSRTFPVEATLERPGEAVKPKMLATVEVATRRLEDVLVIPMDAVLRTADGYRALVVVEREEGQVAESRPLRLGPSGQNRVVVEEGLEPGDRLVVRGHQIASAGDRVRVVEGGAEDAR